MTLIERIADAITTDDEDQSECLQNMYENATSQQRQAIDGAMIYICGYSLKTLISEEGRGCDG